MPNRAALISFISFSSNFTPNRFDLSKRRSASNRNFSALSSNVFVVGAGAGLATAGAGAGLGLRGAAVAGRAVTAGFVAAGALVMVGFLSNVIGVNLKEDATVAFTVVVPAIVVVVAVALGVGVVCLDPSVCLTMGSAVVAATKVVELTGDAAVLVDVEDTEVVLGLDGFLLSKIKSTSSSSSDNTLSFSIKGNFSSAKISSAVGISLLRVHVLA